MYQGTRWGSLTSQQRCSRCIIQPQPTGLLRHSLGETYPSAEMQSVYYTAPADWATETLIGGDLPLSRGAVGVLYSPSRLGYWDTHWGRLTPQQRCSWCIIQPQPTGLLRHSLGETYPSAEVQLVYYTAPADWATETLIVGVLPLSRGAVGVFYSPSRASKSDEQDMLGTVEEVKMNS